MEQKFRATSMRAFVLLACCNATVEAKATGQLRRACSTQRALEEILPVGVLSGIDSVQSLARIVR
jgi:hypothetical protein